MGISHPLSNEFYGGTRGGLGLGGALMLSPDRTPPSSPLSCCSPVHGQEGFLQHHVSRMDMLAGIAIKYGVEVGAQTETELKEKESRVKTLECNKENAGVNGSVVIEKVLAIDNSRYGYNAATGKYEDLMAAGIIDQTKVMDSDLREELCFHVPSAACYIKGRTTITFSEINLLLAVVASQSQSE
ncbi:hypothetical protein ZWY2020_007715 [Hordeum vulgare]|nr:hypothetical protein ZWY2020_007715 [Hordeum vulgare]